MQQNICPARADSCCRHQPHFYAEMHRHGLEKHLKTSAGTADMEYVLNKPNGSSLQRIDDLSGYNARLVSVAEQFFGIDGMTPRQVMPYPHEPLRPQPWHKYDHLSCQDRLDQLDLPQEDKDLFIPHTNSFGSSPAADSAWTDALRWYAAGGYSFPTMYDAVGCFKLGGGGTTNMCRHILAEYQGDRLFNKAVSSVKQTKNLEVVITCADGSTYRARRAICTIPLNCLSDIKFDPPLSPNKQIAVQEGHINFGEKYHISLDEPQGNWFANTCDKDSAFLFGIKDHNGMSKLQAPLNSTELVTDHSRYTVYKSSGRICHDVWAQREAPRSDQARRGHHRIQEAAARGERTRLRSAHLVHRSICERRVVCSRSRLGNKKLESTSGAARPRLYGECGLGSGLERLH